MNVRSRAEPRPDGGSWTLLALALPLLFFATGRWIVPVAAWLAPVVLLRFVRTQPALPGLLAGAAVAILAGIFSWRGAIPVPGFLYYVLAATFGLVHFLPFILDRLIARRLENIASTLVFPLAWTSLEWLAARTSPYGTWGAAAYTQTDNLPLMQLLAVTGLPGVGFLIAWFAAIVNGAWERGFEWKRVRDGVLLYAAVLGLVLFAGGLRLALAPPRAPTVRIAGLTARPDDAAWRIMGLLAPHPSETAVTQVRKATRALQDTLLARSEREARAGARVVLWSEINGLVVKEDLEGLVDRGRTLARRARIWLFMALAVATPGAPAYENLLVAVRPDGSVAYRYHKAHPVPGDPETGADPRIPHPVEASFGRIGAAICFDADFPTLIGTAGREAADILLVPSSDWAAIDPIHTRMALCRGIENGCAVVRQTAKGLSAAADHQGRILAATDYFRAADVALVAQVPTHGARTIYARVGDLFAWVALAGLVLVMIMALRPRRREDQGRGAGAPARSSQSR